MENTPIEQSIAPNSTSKISSLLLSAGVIVLFGAVVWYVALKPKVFEKQGFDYALVISPFDNYRVEKLIVVDPVENVDLFEFHSGDVINIQDLPNKQLAIRVEVSPSTSSVLFNYNGVERWRIDNLAPFSASYELYGNFDLLPVLLGENAITITPYEKSRARGDAGTTREIVFTITNETPVSAEDSTQTVAGPEVELGITTTPFE